MAITRAHTGRKIISSPSFSSRSSSASARRGTASPTFEVYKVLDQKVEGNNLLYRIRWKGYGPSFDTWEPWQNLGGCQEALDAWRKKNGHGPAGGRKRPLSEPLVHGSKNSKKLKGKPIAKVLERPTALTLSELNDGVEGPTITIDVPTRVVSHVPSPTSIFLYMQTHHLQKLPKASPYAEPPTRPAVLAHPDYKLFVEKLKKLKGPEVQLVNDVDDVPSPPTDFEFIPSLRLSDDVEGFDPDFLFGCECPESGCIDEDECSCLDDLTPRRFAYNKHGRVVRNNRNAIIECNNKCTCGPTCENRLVQNGRQIKLQIFKTANKGWAIRSPEYLKKGTFIDLYLGEVLGPIETERRAAEGHAQGLSYLFDLDKFGLDEAQEEDELSVGMDSNGLRDNYTIDGRYCGGVTRFVNHSCDPNLECYAVTSDRRDEKVYDLALFTCRAVQPFEELTYSYVDITAIPSVATPSGSSTEESWWPCYCGSHNCVKKLWS